MGAGEPAQRVRAFDGLRGWAALAVVGFHFSWELFGNRFSEFRNVVFETLLNGRFAVFLFFCISGFAVTVGTWRRPGSDVARQLIRRHSRLAIPVLASCLLVYLLMQAGVTAHRQAAAITGASSWSGGDLRFSPTECNVVTYALVEVFWFVRGTCEYNPFLWTMSFELWGSALVILMSMIQGRRRPYLVLLILSLAAFVHPAGGAFACFTLGATLALAYLDGHLVETRTWLSVGGIAASLLVAALPLSNYQSGVVMPLLGAIVLLLVLTNRVSSAFFEAPFSQFLGRISFPLYLMQWTVLISITSYLIIWFEQMQALHVVTAGVIFVASILISVACAVLFMPVERLTAWVGRRLQQLIPVRATLSTPPTGH